MQINGIPVAEGSGNHPYRLPKRGYRPVVPKRSVPPITLSPYQDAKVTSVPYKAFSSKYCLKVFVFLFSG